MEMENNESKTTGSCWEVAPNSSKWLAENLKEMDQSVKQMLKLIEEGASDTNELISNVDEFHQLYRSLAERYDHVTRESCKSVTLGSGDSESPLQTPDVKVHVPKLVDQSSGTIDTSPSSPGADSVFSSLSSSSDSDSESFVTSYLRKPLSINSQNLHQKMAELEAELLAAKDKLQTREAYLECEIENLKRELSERTSEGNLVKNQLELAREAIASFEAQLGSEKEHVVELEEMIARYNADLSDRDIEVWELKVALRDVEEQFSQEKASLESDILSLSESLSRLDVELRESEAEEIETREQLAVLRKDFDRCATRCDELMGSLSGREDQILEMESYISEIHKRCNELAEESREARELAEELKPRVEELQNEVDRLRVAISDGAEEKREAIRQLCFSIEHYRSGYQELRQAFVGNRRNVVMAA